MSTLQGFLRPQVLTQVISRQAIPSNWLGALFGIQSGMDANGKSRGKNVKNEGHGRHGRYHIYDHLRKVAAGRAPGAAAHRNKQNPLGLVQFVYPRMFDSLDFDIEKLNNLGKITDPHMRDAQGMQHIEFQTRSLSEMADNWRKAMTIGMVRDELFINKQGDSEYFDFSQTAGARSVIPVEFRRPNGNKGKLNMLGTGDIIDKPWTDVTADIPLHFSKIDAAFQELCGGYLSAAIITNEMFNNMTRNNRVKELHGTANQPFNKFAREEFDENVAKSMKKVKCAQFSFAPNTYIFVTDEGLELGKPGQESYQKIVPDDKGIFIGHTPDDGTVCCYEGSEPIRERDHLEKVVKTGLSSWYAGSANPTVDEIFVLDNALPVNHVPVAQAMGDLVF